MKPIFKLSMSVQEPWFGFIKNGKKSIEVRLARQKYLSLHKGDFVNINDLEVEILDVKIYPSFRELLLKEGIEKVLPGITNLKDAVGTYRRFYNEIEEKQLGVLAIFI